MTIYPDAEKYIQQRLFQERIENTVAEIRAQPQEHALRKTLLKTELLPYQLDGIAFAVGAGVGARKQVFVAALAIVTAEGA